MNLASTALPNALAAATRTDLPSALAAATRTALPSALAAAAETAAPAAARAAPRPSPAHDGGAGDAASLIAPAPDGAHLAAESPREVVLVTGISGSGKSVALHALEDAGFYCVDNLPPELLRPFLSLEHQRAERRVAVAVDSRSAGSLPKLVPLLDELRGEGITIRSVFLDSSTNALVRRFSETRRPHPLTRQTADTPGTPQHRALVDAIEMEREMLAELREVSTVIDTSQLRPAQLRQWMLQLLEAGGARMTLVFESFAFKHGVPLDADFVFDVRVVPNPFYIRELRPLTGRDEPVVLYLESQPEAIDMLLQIEQFLARWLPAFEEDLRSYLTVAVGCTGGQHRSVYFVEMLARRFGASGSTLVRHRELDAKG